MTLKDIMTTHPKTVRPTDTLTLARSLMVWGDCRSLPVVEGTEFVGLLTELDIARYQARIGESIASNPNDTVKMVMVPNPQTARPTDSITEATARFVEYKLTSLPVVDKKRLLGIVTTTDLLRQAVRKAMQPPDEGPCVGDVMTLDPVRVHPDDLVLDAAGRMRSARIRHLPVVDGDDCVVGMLSDRDVRAAVGDPVQDSATVEDLRVRHCMTRPVVTAWPDQSCAEAARAFAMMHASAVPVVTRDDGKLIGILSYVDLLRGKPASASAPSPSDQ